MSVRARRRGDVGRGSRQPGLGMRLDEVAPGRARLSMTITEAMANGHGICHGGFIFALADSAMAFAANPRGEAVVAQHAAITFVRPGKVGEVLVADAARTDAGRAVGNVRRARLHRGRRTGRRVPRPYAHDPWQGGGIDGRPRRDRNRLARRDRRVAARAAGVDAAPRLRQRAALPRRVRSRRRASGRFPHAGRHREVPVHHQAGPARELSVRHVRRAAREAGARARLVRHHRQADGGGLYRAGHRDLGACRGALDLRRRRAAGDDRACRVRLRPVHRRPRRALRRGEAGLHGGAGIGRHDRAAGAADHRLPSRRDHGDAELHAGDPGRVPAPGARSARLLAEDRHLRRRTLDQRDAPRDRGRLRDGCRGHLRTCPR